MTESQADQPSRQLSAIRVALVLNVLMAGVGIALGIFGRSLGIFADALDMAADGSGYGLSLLAEGRPRLQRLAARWIGVTLIVLGLGILIEAFRRWIWGGTPLGPVMMAYSVIAFCVNVYVMTRLNRFKQNGVHLNAIYLCTRVDILANIALFVSGGVVWLTGWRWFDPLVAVLIAAFVFHESREIFEQAEESEES